MMKLSFVLPCYNVERYIADCLDSIFSQDLPSDEYEVICVNDCSTDKTRDIILEYQKKHVLLLIDHEKNRSVGAARNTGLSAANGEYVWFVDPDDMIVDDTAGQLLSIAEETNTEILFFNNCCVDELGKYVGENSCFTNSPCMSGSEFVQRFFPGKMSSICIVWSCLFSRRFLCETGARFPEMCKGEDVVFIWKCLLSAERVASLKDVFYLYRNNPYSVAKMSDKANVIFSEYILLSKEILLMIEDKKKCISDVAVNDMKQTVRWHVNHIQALYQMPKTELAVYSGLIKNNKTTIAALSSYMSRKVRWLYGVYRNSSFLMAKMRLLWVMNKFHLVHIG